VGKQTPLITSFVLSVTSLLLFAGLWAMDWVMTDCPTWFESLGFSCGVFVWVSYLAVCPMLSILAIAFAVRDVVHKERRIRAIAAFGMAVGVLLWYWRSPPH
jgi:hypothetical protein